MKDIHLKNSLKLSLLLLNKEDKNQFVSKFDKVLGLIDKISNFKFDTKLNAIEREFSILRDDQIESSLSIKSIKKFSNSFLDGYFSSPRVLK